MKPLMQLHVIHHAAHSDLFCLFVCQVYWRWCRPCCSWETWPSRRSVTLTRPPCLMTLVHTFIHSQRDIIILSCLFYSICLNCPTSSDIHMYILQRDPRVSPPAAQKVCHLLSINVTDFSRAILSPRIKVCVTFNSWKFLVMLLIEIFILIS